MAKRPKSNAKVTSAGEIGQLQFNEFAYAQRNVTVGGVYDFIGPVATAQRVGEFATIMVANTDTAAHWIAIGDLSVAAPSGLTNGYYLPPQSYTHLCTGEKGAYVRADSATVGVYKLQENIIVRNEPE
jgi:hypothetical protein